MLIGYQRVSTDSQNLLLQKDSLIKAGCERIFEDIISGSSSERSGLSALLNFIQPGDVLVVWKLDRLGRSLKHLVGLINELSIRNIGFKTLTEGIDTTTSQGRLTLHLFAALAEFERELITERCRAGLDAARSRGRIGGRRQKLTEAQMQIAIQLFEERNISVGEIAKSLGISRATIYRNLKSNKAITPQ